VHRITAQDPEEGCTESTHKKLSKQQIAILAQWIDNGAEYRGTGRSSSRSARRFEQKSMRVRRTTSIVRYQRLEREASPRGGGRQETLINRVRSR